MTIDRTVYITNLHPNVTENHLHELFVQAGPVSDVTHKGNFAFVTFEHEESVLYACSLLEGVRLFETPMDIKPRKGSKHEKMRFPSVGPYDIHPPVNDHRSQQQVDPRYIDPRLAHGVYNNHHGRSLNQPRNYSRQEECFHRYPSDVPYFDDRSVYRDYPRMERPDYYDPPQPHRSGYYRR